MELIVILDVLLLNIIVFIDGRQIDRLEKDNEDLNKYINDLYSTIIKGGKK